MNQPHSGSTALRGDLPFTPGPDPADAPGRVLFGEAWSAFGYANPVLTATVNGAQVHQALEDQWRLQADGTVRFAPFGVSPASGTRTTPPGASGTGLTRRTS